jgi:hypothetical protein
MMVCSRRGDGARWRCRSSADRGAARPKVDSCGGGCRRWRWRRTVRLGRRRRWAYRRQGCSAPALEAGGGVGRHVFRDTAALRWISAPSGTGAARRHVPSRGTSCLRRLTNAMNRSPDDLPAARRQQRGGLDDSGPFPTLNIQRSWKLAWHACSPWFANIESNLFATWLASPCVILHFQREGGNKKLFLSSNLNR